MSYRNRMVSVSRGAASALTLILLMLWGGAPASASTNCSEASFRLPQHFDMASTPQALIAADFNGDGRPDIVASAESAVELRLNDGMGWFGAPVSFDSGGNPGGLGAGDLNGDGRLDLIVAHPAGSHISFLPGDGAGGFGVPVNFEVGARVISVVAADFNGDGKTDAAVGYLGAGEAGFVTVLLGDGAGGFSLAGTSPAGGIRGSLAVADFNKDGKRDLALTTFNNVLVLPGDGAGGFASPREVMAGNARHLAPADYNGDGNTDLAVAFRDDGISLLVGDGTGGFSAPTLVPTGPLSSPAQVAAADFNGDGKIDLAAALRGWSSAGVLLGDGAGGFGAARSYGAGNFPSLIVAADFNGDGANDLAVGTGQGVLGSTTGFIVLLGSGGGELHAAPTLPVHTSPVSSFSQRAPDKMALADFNNDGRTDIAVSNSRGGGPPTVSIFLAGATGGFTAAPGIRFPQGTSTGPLAAADFNRDGKVDLALTIPFDVFGRAHSVAIYLGDGAGGFSLRADVRVFTPNDIEVADFNNDSVPDLAVKKENNFVALIGDGAGNFSSFEGPSGGASFSDITVADLNRDGKQDVAVTDYHNGKVYVTLGAGNGTFDFMRHVEVGAGPLAVEFADFNGDNSQDMAVTRSTGQSSGVVTILPGTGTGAFGTPASYEIGAQPESLVVGDLNGDGKPDLVTGDLFSVGISALTGNGDGTFRPRVGFPLDVGPSHLLAHDFNNDGRLDLAAAQTGAYTIALLLNDLTTPLPCLSIADVTFAEGSAGETEGEFVVTLSGPSDKTVKVNYLFHGFPATAGQDFKAAPGSLIFPPGTTTQKIKVLIVGDAVDEEDESFRVILRSPLNALLSDDVALGNLPDDDPQPSISVGDDSAVEGNSPFGTSVLSFNVTLSAPSAKLVTVQYSTTPGTATANEYFGGGGTLQFAPGETAKPVQIVIRGDTVHEADETFTLDLSNPTNATISDGSGQGTILNDDPVPTLSVPNASAGETPTQTGGMTVRVRLSNQTDRTVTVAYATADDTATAGSDYVATSGTLTFNPLELEKSFIVPVIDDAVDEVHETFNVILSNAVNAALPASPGVCTIGDDDGPAISVNDVSVAEGDSGPTLVTFTLSLSAPSPQFVGVVVSTADGSANARSFRSDYQAITNRFVLFPAGSTTATLTVFVNGDQIIEPDETFFVNLSRPQEATVGDGMGVGTITNDDVTSVQFATDALTVNEADGSLQVTVRRVGDLSGVFTASYTTFNGSASERSDYNAALGTLRFEPNESSKTITVFITNDALVEETEDFFIFLNGVGGGATNEPSAVTVTLNSDDAALGPNPLDDPTFFVRQHYRDFLGRDPDAEGLAFWVGIIEECGNDVQCRRVRRINVSAAFFLSIEFQETGYLAYRTHKAAFGDATSPGVPGTVPVIRLRDFLPDAQRMGEGVRVGIGDWRQRLEENKNAYALEFVQRRLFLTAFPTTMTAEQFVARLEQNTGAALSPDEKAALVSALGSTPADPAKRAQVLRAVAEDADLRRAELNRAFVLMQYYGYMRRNPNDPQDSDFSGWKFWLDKLEQFNGDFVRAEMVRAFIESIEYRHRFGR